MDYSRFLAPPGELYKFQRKSMIPGPPNRTFIAFFLPYIFQPSLKDSPLPNYLLNLYGKPSVIQITWVGSHVD
jgi:hypothetical protein